jgi:hypothetical protein
LAKPPRKRPWGVRFAATIQIGFIGRSQTARRAWEVLGESWGRRSKREAALAPSASPTRRVPCLSSAANCPAASTRPGAPHREIARRAARARRPGIGSGAGTWSGRRRSSPGAPDLGSAGIDSGMAWQVQGPTAPHFCGAMPLEVGASRRVPGLGVRTLPHFHRA